MYQVQGSEPQIVSRLADVLKSMRANVSSALYNGGITTPGMVLIGYPTWTEAVKVLSQPGTPGFVTIDALPDIRNVTRYEPSWGQVGPLVTAFSATFTYNSVTLSQIVANPAPAGTNVFVFFTAFSGGNYSAQYTTVAGDTPSSVATAVAAAINTLAVSGVSATPSGNAVNVSGAMVTACNVGGSAPAHKEVARVMRTIQVSIWVAGYWPRYQIHEAISNTLGACDAHGVQLPDGGWYVIKPKGENFDDKAQESTNVYIAHLTYSVEYGVIQRGTATQICEVDLQTIIESEQGQQINETTSLIS